MREQVKVLVNTTDTIQQPPLEETEQTGLSKEEMDDILQNLGLQINTDMNPILSQDLTTDMDLQTDFNANTDALSFDAQLPNMNTENGAQLLNMNTEIGAQLLNFDDPKSILTDDQAFNMDDNVFIPATGANVNDANTGGSKGSDNVLTADLVSNILAPDVPLPGLDSNVESIGSSEFVTSLSNPNDNDKIQANSNIQSVEPKSVKSSEDSSKLPKQSNNFQLNGI